MSWLDGLAAYLGTLGVGLTYRESSGYLDTEVGVVIGPLPAAPPEVVGVTAYGGRESDTRLPYDEPSVQLRVRGTPDERVSRDRAQALYDALHGAGPLTLPDGTRVQLIVGAQSGPITLGLDSAGVHEHTVNFRVEIRRVTAHRQ